ncbi:YcxB family protein [Halomonadaceae bacterium KBTZ08]
MLTVALDASAENKRGRLRAIKSPRFRSMLIGISIILLALASVSIFSVDDTLFQKVRNLLMVTLAIPFVVWFFGSHRYYGFINGTPQDIGHQVSGKKVTFEYEVSSTGIVEYSEGNETTFPYNQYLRYEERTEALWLVFYWNVIYIPKRCVEAGSVSEFIEEFKRAHNNAIHATSA